MVYVRWKHGANMADDVNVKVEESVKKLRYRLFITFYTVVMELTVFFTLMYM